MISEYKVYVRFYTHLFKRCGYIGSVSNYFVPNKPVLQFLPYRKLTEKYKLLVYFMLVDFSMHFNKVDARFTQKGKLIKVSNVDRF